MWLRFIVPHPYALRTFQNPYLLISLAALCNIFEQVRFPVALVLHAAGAFLTCMFLRSVGQPWPVTHGMGVHALGLMLDFSMELYHRRRFLRHDLQQHQQQQQGPKPGEQCDDSKGRTEAAASGGSVAVSAGAAALSEPTGGAKKGTATGDSSDEFGTEIPALLPTQRGLDTMILSSVTASTVGNPPSVPLSAPGPVHAITAAVTDGRCSRCGGSGRCDADRCNGGGPACASKWEGEDSASLGGELNGASMDGVQQAFSDDDEFGDLNGLNHLVQCDAELAAEAGGADASASNYAVAHSAGGVDGEGEGQQDAESLEEALRDVCEEVLRCKMFLMSPGRAPLSQVHVTIPWLDPEQLPEGVIDRVTEHLESRYPHMHIVRATVRKGSVLIAFDILDTSAPASAGTEAANAAAAEAARSVPEAEEWIEWLPLPEKQAGQRVHVQVDQKACVLQWEPSTQQWVQQQMQQHPQEPLVSLSLASPLVVMEEEAGSDAPVHLRATVWHAGALAGSGLAAADGGAGLQLRARFRGAAVRLGVTCKDALPAAVDTSASLAFLSEQQSDDGVTELEITLHHDASSMPGGFAGGSAMLEVWQGYTVLQSAHVLLLAPGQAAMAAEIYSLQSAGDSREQQEEAELFATRLGLWLEHCSAAMQRRQDHVDVASRRAAVSWGVLAADAPMVRMGRELLDKAVSSGWVATATELMSGLLAQGAGGPGFGELAAGASSPGFDLLHLAVTSGKPQMIAQVIRWGAEHQCPFSWSARSACGVTPLHLAIIADRSGRLARAIFSRFADARVAWHHVQDRSGRTPAMLAQEVGAAAAVAGIMEDGDAEQSSVTQGTSSGDATPRHTPNSAAAIARIAASMGLPAHAGLDMASAAATTAPATLAAAAMINPATVTAAASPPAQQLSAATPRLWPLCAAPVLGFSDPALEGDFRAFHTAAAASVGRWWCLLLPVLLSLVCLRNAPPLAALTSSACLAAPYLVNWWAAARAQSRNAPRSAAWGIAPFVTRTVLQVAWARGWLSYPVALLGLAGHPLLEWMHVTTYTCFGLVLFPWAVLLNTLAAPITAWRYSSLGIPITRSLAYHACTLLLCYTVDLRLRHLFLRKQQCQTAGSKAALGNTSSAGNSDHPARAPSIIDSGSAVQLASAATAATAASPAPSQPRAANTERATWSAAWLGYRDSAAEAGFRAYKDRAAASISRWWCLLFPVTLLLGTIRHYPNSAPVSAVCMSAPYLVIWWTVTVRHRGQRKGELLGLAPAAMRIVLQLFWAAGLMRVPAMVARMPHHSMAQTYLFVTLFSLCEMMLLPWSALLNLLGVPSTALLRYSLGPCDWVLLRCCATHAFAVLVSFAQNCWLRYRFRASWQQQGPDAVAAASADSKAAKLER